MKFEEIIKKISSTVAAIAVFLVASGMYLSFKGFVIGADGRPVLVQNAQAKSKSVSAAPELKDNQAVNLPKNHVLGKKNAPVTIYEFSSFGCYHCKHFHLDILPKLKKDFINDGKVRLIFVDFPLDQKSFQASLIARCIPQDKYYDFLALLFKKQREWGYSKNTEEFLINLASLNGISKEKAKACLKDEAMVKEFADIRLTGIETLKITGTPSFLFVSGNEREIVHGVPDYSTFKEIIEKKLQNLTTK